MKEKKEKKEKHEKDKQDKQKPEASAVPFTPKAKPSAKVEPKAKLQSSSKTEESKAPKVIAAETRNRRNIVFPTRDLSQRSIPVCP